MSHQARHPAQDLRHRSYPLDPNEESSARDPTVGGPTSLPVQPKHPIHDLFDGSLPLPHAFSTLTDSYSVFLSLALTVFDLGFRKGYEHDKVVEAATAQLHSVFEKYKLLEKHDTSEEYDVQERLEEAKKRGEPTKWVRLRRAEFSFREDKTSAAWLINAALDILAKDMESHTTGQADPAEINEAHEVISDILSPPPVTAATAFTPVSRLPVHAPTFQPGGHVHQTLEERHRSERR
ncbi:hypothetical protein JCM10212_002605 [Sporobolomyces blumeae]